MEAASASYQIGGDGSFRLGDLSFFMTLANISENSPDLIKKTKKI
jgi:hypothetical protein